MKTGCKVLLIILLIMIIRDGNGQVPIRFDRLGTENIRIERGLSQNTINCIFQDHKGYLWFGTWDGLNKFDGYTFTIFRPDLFGPEDGLSNQTATCINEDAHGTLWIGTEFGLNRFNRDNRKFQRFLRNSGDSTSISSDTINYLLFDRKQRLWVATENGLNLMDQERGVFKRFMSQKSNQQSLGNPVVRWLYEDPNGHIWAATRAGISILNPETGIFTQISRKNQPGLTLRSDTIHCIIPDPSGLIWLGTEKGLEVFDPVTKSFNEKEGVKDHLQKHAVPVNVVYLDSQQRLWAGTQGDGLRLYDNYGRSFTSFRYVSEDPNSMSDDYVLSIKEDRSGILWVGTNWKGLNKISDNTVRFNHYKHLSDDDNSLNNNLVWSIIEGADRTLWIATDLGVNILDRSKGKFSFLRHQPGNSNTLASDKVSRIYHDRSGYVWIGSFDKGVSRFDPQSGKFLHYNTYAPPERRLPHDDIGAILQDRKGNIWIGTGDGLVRLEKGKGNPIPLALKQGNSNTHFSNDITCLYEDKQGMLWIGTYKALYKYDLSSDSMEIYQHIAAKESTISSDVIYSILEDSKGNFWVGTRGGGLNLMDRKTGIFKTYTEQDGLPSNLVYAIMEDKDGNLWMSTNYGLSVFNPMRETFINFDVRDGLQSNEFNLGAAYVNDEGEMFFGGMNGFNAFYPERIRRNTQIPLLAVPEFHVFNERLPRDLKNGDTIRLEHDENSFTILFSALDFTNPMRNQYSYWLEKIDKGWIYTDGSKRFAEYTRVPPGTYTFRFRGSNNDGTWNEDPFTLVIIISPPWYATWWFRLLAGLTVLVLLGSGIWLRFKRIERRHSMEKQVLSFETQLIDIRQKAMRLQMNPHFIFNSLNSIQSFVLRNDTDKAIHYLSKFSQLMRQILSNSNEAYVPLKEELKALEYYMDIERLRFDNKFTYAFILPEGIDDEFIEIPPMIIQPYVENAIIHGLVNKQEEGHITIRINRSEDLLHWEVEDNGIGREAARRLRDEYSLHRKSRGMMITKQRLEILNTGASHRFGVEVIDLKDSAGKAIGTRVVIDMPIREA